MNSKNTSLIILLLIQTANAYIDPGTGSMMFQMLIAFFVGSLYLVKVYWEKIKTFLRNILRKK